MRPLALFALTLLAACTSSSTRVGWWQETAADLGGKLGGCVVADLDPALPGNEIAVVGGDGGVHLIWRGPDGWQQRRPHTTEGESIQVIAGDLIPQRAGIELVALGVATGTEDGGGKGRATAMALTVDRETWLKSLLESEALIHAGALGDLDPNTPGDELVYAGFFGEARLLAGLGKPQVLGPLPGNAKGAAIGAGGVVFACDDGSLVRFRLASTGWRADVLYRAPDALARVAATDDAVLFCANDGALRLWRADEAGAARTLYQSEDRLRGAVIADLDPSHPGLEYATAGYDGRIVVVSDATTATGHRQMVSVVGVDPDRLHHLAVGELPGLGRCLVACGYGGRVIIVGYGERD